MLGIGFSELLLTLAIALVFVGPDKLPEVGRFIGKIIGKINRTTHILMEDDVTILLKQGHKPENVILAKAFEKLELTDEAITHNNNDIKEAENQVNIG